ncbi:chromosome segregation SMC family protein [Leptospira ilyithenensis]|uniref:Chromosome partition protein Smc n=1 Tax=Leptospira ilyithenensis TaxID=2484901 RepID=A0A4R9LSW3_9LEPT|nr:AAA family ATPase [Leptospira ilyithenensis]TGN11992.1 chromosome partitioning protein ParA [Leptospira ilyithenensis]
MHLKSLNIVGFKTFADETEIAFDPGFTAVVGPNGSGKSNIVDSVKWVFGEKSAKGLRGEKMDDVIFHGTESRRAAGFSEVSILFDNHDNYFSIDFPSVKITRRLYPDGENEYYLNDVRSARKDIEKTLLDTGIGKSSYSILEQGRVDQILNSKPEERRAIFEEAAGVSRFKLDRKEATKKLDDTNQNLLRIQDIMNSMIKEMETKEKQSEKAEAYFKLKAELDESDKNLRYLKLRDFKKRMKKSDEDLLDIRDKNKNLLSQIQDETSLISEKEKFKEAKEREIADIDKKLFDHLSRTQIQKEKISKNKTFIAEYDIRLSDISRVLDEENQSAVKLEVEKKQIESETEHLKEIQTHLSKEIQNQEVIRKDLEDKIKSEEESILTKETKIQENEKRHISLREKQKLIIQELIQELENKKKESQGNEEKRNEDKAVLLANLESYQMYLETSYSYLNQGNLEDLSTELRKIDLSSYKEQLNVFLQKEDSFRNLLFDKDGVLSKKEVVDQDIEDLLLENENLTRSIRESQALILSLRNHWETARNLIVDLDKKVLETQSRIDNQTRQTVELNDRIAEIFKRIASSKEQETGIREKREKLEKEVISLEKEIEDSYQEFLSMSKMLESEKESLQKLLEEIQNLKSNISKNQEVFQTLLPLLSEKERTSSALKVQIDSLIEELYNDYSLTDSELEMEKGGATLEQKEEERRLRSAKSEIQLLGSINPLAIEEYRTIKEVYEHNLKQKEDIESSKKDIEDVLKRINTESEKLFQETFEKIKANFQETFSTLFNGGRATLELTEKEDSLNSGVEIMAEPPGKHVQNLRLLSGGEKSLTAIALLFAIYMVKPSPFCFLDEIDAALDEANKLRFCQILDRFKDKTQFIVVSHAQSTISRANAIFGVTNEEPGISKIVSLRLDEAKVFSKQLSKTGTD